MSSLSSPSSSISSSPAPNLPSPTPELEPDSGAPVAGERPLPAGRYALFLFTSTLLIAAFYAYAILTLVFGGGLWLLIITVTIVGSQYGGAVILPALQIVGKILGVLARSLRLKKGVDFHIKVSRQEAPRLWSVIEDLAKTIGTAPPREIVLENGVNAYVHLTGLFAGHGKTRLGVGFDLLLGLSEAQARGVMAHELAHAKYVQRGYRSYLMRGLARAGRCSESLTAIADYEKNPRMARAVARFLAYVPGKIEPVVNKLLAVCSRYDEFLADRVAAQICGAQVCREALLATHVLDYQADRIDYREKLLHLERAPGYSAWLHERLHVPDDEKRLEIEARALEHSFRHELSTHPALPDRLRALDEVQGQAPPFEGARDALGWLGDANALAAKLLREIERTAAEQERKATASLAKSMRKRENRQGDKATPQQIWALVAALFGGMFVLVVLTVSSGAGFNASPASRANGLLYSGVFLALAIVGLVMMVVSDRVTLGELPVPAFADYLEALLGIHDERREAREQYFESKSLADDEKWARNLAHSETEALSRVAMMRELRTLLPAKLTKPLAKADFWCVQGFEALAKCDYERALGCAHLAFECKQDYYAALLIYGIYGAAYRLEGSGKALERLSKERTSFTMRWGLAWSMCLWGNDKGGEAYLLELVRQKPKSAILWSLLGHCQAGNGKPRESLNSRRRALELAQQSGDRADEACHRYLLAQNEIALGQLADAGTHLDWLEAYRRELDERGEKLRGIVPFRLELVRLSWLIASGETESALKVAQDLSERESAARTQIEIADMLDCDDPTLRESSRTFYERVLETGFYPQAHLSLSSLAYRAEDLATARAHALQALDGTRERPLYAAHPIALLEDALGNLRTIADRAPQKDVKAWEAEVNVEDSPLKVKKLTFLGLFESEEKMRDAVLELMAALWPGGEVAEQVTVKLAPKDIQPDGPIPPGLYRAKWDSKS